jgi:hypothetical protein
MNRKVIPTLVVALMLAVGIGVSGALAGDDHPQPAPPPVSCASLAPGGDEGDAADAVANAAENVSEEAENEQGDDEQGDQAQGDDDDQGEQGDCDDDDQGDDD